MNKMTIKEFRDWKKELLERAEVATREIEDHLGLVVNIAMSLPINYHGVVDEFQLISFSIKRFREEIEKLRFKGEL